MSTSHDHRHTPATIYAVDMPRTGQVVTAIAWADAGLQIAFAEESLGAGPTDPCHSDSPGSVGVPVHVGGDLTADEGRRS